MAKPKSLPAVLAGPILRRLQPKRLTFWLATRARAKVRIELFPTEAREQVYEILPEEEGGCCIAAGRNLYYILIDLPLDAALPTEKWIAYRLSLFLEDDQEGGWQDHTNWAPDLCYEQQTLPGFILSQNVRALLHGSCRKPHHDSTDGLVLADDYLANRVDGVVQEGPTHCQWPAALVMSGDQIYADDVAGPVLRAIHGLIQWLGFEDEDLSQLDSKAPITGTDLYKHKDTYFNRESFLPNSKAGKALGLVLFKGAEKPIFTSVHARNHLITLAEFFCMYLLVWSPAAWEVLSPDEPEGLSPADLELYRNEQGILQNFIEGLPAVRRLMAHLPVAMIFDDHDVTDDWNLNRNWEDAAYGHPFSNRIIGNALAAYFLHQGWGNRPEAFSMTEISGLQHSLANPGGQDHTNFERHLFAFENWDYHWATKPPLVVLDTRTRRWRSERSGDNPSGLLDWEAITDLQRELRGQESVLLVSAAPIFGVKLIETLQKLMTYLGKPLAVDAEYWMAHPGTAEGILNVFRHRKTPERFTILSGDVHYSFVYDVELRGHSGGPTIWQVCSSGIKNEFPKKLLNRLDHLNRWLYAPRSPLNWFTRRRRMRVIPRKPVGTPHGQRLLNQSGIGVIEFDKKGGPIKIAQLVAKGEEVEFSRRENEARWD
ncbi:alkaline phosphatase D family protein [Flexibacterium corallicola]|uniref:alkaline phosphatase D family protein n=1 Tax=Flexibacterium corallicola TaxID=3037259 RepID=UPI00286EEEDF|nr:alkaline phosphatase D family protein [Pseudovibrio sp. M1P-2-3]